MTDTTTEARPLQPGEVLHVLSERGALIAGEAYRRGDTFALTAQQIENTRGRDGRSWCDDISESGQRARWGAPRFGLGPWPGGPTWIYGSTDWAVQRDAANRAAHAIPNPGERAAALQRVREEFGAPPATSHTDSPASGPEQRQQPTAARPSRRRDLEAEIALQDLMDAGRAQAAERELQRQEFLSDFGEA